MGAIFSSNKFINLAMKMTPSRQPIAKQPSIPNNDNTCKRLRDTKPNISLSTRLYNRPVDDKNLKAVAKRTR